MAGYLFTTPDNYKIEVYYRYKTYSQEVKSTEFIIIKRPRQVKISFSAGKVAVGTKLPCEKFNFGLFDKNENLIMVSTNCLFNQ